MSEEKRREALWKLRNHLEHLDVELLEGQLVFLDDEDDEAHYDIFFEHQLGCEPATDLKFSRRRPLDMESVDD